MAVVQPNSQHALQSSPSPLQPNAPAATAVVQQAVLQPQQPQRQQQPAQQQFQVAVSEAAVPGQQILFTAPDGQRAMVTAQENLQPGSVINVQCPYRQQPPTEAQPGNQQSAIQSYQPTVLPNVTVSAEEADRRASSNYWLAYGLTWGLCCCCSPPIAMLVWAGLACNFYFCKPRAQQELRPRQRKAAQASSATFCAGCGCGLLMLIGAAALHIHCGGQDLPECFPQFRYHFVDPFGPPGHHHHDHHHGQNHSHHHPNHSGPILPAVGLARSRWAHVNNFHSEALPIDMPLKPVNTRFMAPRPALEAAPLPALEKLPPALEAAPLPPATKEQDIFQKGMFEKSEAAKADGTVEQSLWKSADKKMMFKRLLMFKEKVKKNWANVKTMGQEKWANMKVKFAGLAGKTAEEDEVVLA